MKDPIPPRQNDSAAVAMTTWGRPAGRRQPSGFSLVEVVVAIGIIAFGIVALLGMLAFSTGLSRSSDQDTVLAAMSRQVTSDLRNCLFEALPNGTGTGNEQVLPPSGTIWYFNGEGAKLTTSKGAIYLCYIYYVADDTYKSSDSKQNLYKVTLYFYSANGTPPPAGTAPPATPQPKNYNLPLFTATTALARIEIPPKQ
jgi:uncharacterized protein (TIGR02598 family)